LLSLIALVVISFDFLFLHFLLLSIGSQ